MVCFFEVPGNVQSEGRSSTFEYRKRKKPRDALFVARPARLTSDFRICRRQCFRTNQKMEARYEIEMWISVGRFLTNRKPGDLSPGLRI